MLTPSNVSYEYSYWINWWIHCYVEGDKPVPQPIIRWQLFPVVPIWCYTQRTGWERTEGLGWDSEVFGVTGVNHIHHSMALGVVLQVHMSQGVNTGGYGKEVNTGIMIGRENTGVNMVYMRSHTHLVPQGLKVFLAPQVPEHQPNRANVYPCNYKIPRERIVHTSQTIITWWSANIDDTTCRTLQQCTLCSCCCWLAYHSIPRYWWSSP